jgi:uroporphyrinogen III methyltransferase / synthase
MNKVYLVGAGPGDPELITLKGRRCLGTADVVLYDHLAAPALLDLAPPAAERIYVGKKRGDHAFSQAEIIDVMLAKARENKTVVRLKGGDPFIFGRGGEEVEALAEAGVPFEVVPGVTAPLGIAAYTGVPLTHREHTSVVTFVTGHNVDSIDWTKTGVSETLVIFMGVNHVAEIIERILAAGRDPRTPAMAVRWGTRPDQQTIAGTLAELPTLIRDLAPPATIIIGDVVSLRAKLDWFEHLPLFGERIVVTRARSQATELSQRLRQLGAEAIEIPVIELAPLEDYSKLDACMDELPSYDWLIFTSVNAVEFFLARMRASNRDWRSVRGRICAIGPATASALSPIIPELIPEEHHSEGVAAAFQPYNMRCARILLPRASTAREVIPATLSEMGATVDVVDVYTNVIPANAQSRIAALRFKPTWVTFTSGSTVKNWLALAGSESLDGVRIASIGPATTDVAKKHGLHVDVEADPSTLDGLVEAITRYSLSLRDAVRDYPAREQRESSST